MPTAQRVTQKVRDRAVLELEVASELFAQAADDLVGRFTDCPIETRDEIDTMVKRVMGAGAAACNAVWEVGQCAGVEWMQ